MRSLLYNGSKVMCEPENYDFRAEVAWIGTVAHSGIMNTGRGGGDWASHFMGHELSAFYDMAHGATLAIIIPAWMRYVYKDVRGLFLQFALRVMDVDATLRNQDEAILEGIDRLEKFFQSIGLPTTMKEANLDDTKLLEMAHDCVFASGKIGSCKILTEKDALEIFKAAFRGEVEI
jgi:hypothetical protein